MATSPFLAIYIYIHDEPKSLDKLIDEPKDSSKQGKGTGAAFLSCGECHI